MPWGKHPTMRSTPLAQWRMRSNRSYQWLAKTSGVSYSTIKRVARGDPVSGKVAMRLSKVTSIRVEDLIEGES